jgi:hypothetical protein
VVGTFAPSSALAGGDPWVNPLAAFCAAPTEIPAVEMRRTVVLELAGEPDAANGARFLGVLRRRPEGTGESTEVLREFRGASCASVRTALQIAADLAEAPETAKEPVVVPSPTTRPVKGSAREGTATFGSVTVRGGLSALPRAAFVLGGELGGGIRRGQLHVEGRVEGGVALPRLVVTGGQTTKFQAYSLGVSALFAADRSPWTLGVGPFLRLDTVGAETAGEAARTARSATIGARTELRRSIVPNVAIVVDVRLGGSVGRDRFFLYRGGEVARTPAVGWSMGVGVSWAFPKPEMASARRRHEPMNSL